MNKYELLEEAKIRYPIGTRVICLCDNIEYYIGDFDHDGSDETSVWCNSYDGWGVQIYKDGIWADIVELQKSEYYYNQRKYSEEEVLKLLCYLRRDMLFVDDFSEGFITTWFEKIKKK